MAKDSCDDFERYVRLADEMYALRNHLINKYQKDYDLEYLGCVPGSQILEEFYSEYPNDEECCRGHEMVSKFLNLRVKIQRRRFNSSQNMNLSPKKAVP